MIVSFWVWVYFQGLLLLVSGSVFFLGALDSLKLTANGPKDRASQKERHAKLRECRILPTQMIHELIRGTNPSKFP